jgi:hypothetical protein
MSARGAVARPSPFPGMDPYLEDSGVFPGCHNALAAEINRYLNIALPRPYYASLESRQELAIGTEDNEFETRKPDVSVMADPWTMSGRGPTTTAAIEYRTEVSPSFDLDFHIDPLDVYFIEIRDAHSGHELVTLIELLSPSNKPGGSDRQSYLEKRNKILHSKASLIEIDLLRRGGRVSSEPDYAAALASQVPPTPYLVAVNRSWRRMSLPYRAYQVFPVMLRASLPVIPVPLREGEAELALDLQYLFRETYAAGPYQRGQVDYTKPPPPPFAPDELAWVRECVAAVVTQ